MTTRTIYPVEHSHFEDKFVPTAGQTEFTLSKAGPFSTSQVCMSIGDKFTAQPGGQAEFVLGHTPVGMFDDPAFYFSLQMVVDDVPLDYENGYSVAVVDDVCTVTFDPPLAEGVVLKVWDHYQAWYPTYAGDDYSIDEDVLTWSGRTLTVEDSLIVMAAFDPARWPEATAGQTVFPDSDLPAGQLDFLKKNIGFTSVLVNGVQKTTGYAITDVDGGQDQAKAWKITFTPGLTIHSLVVAVFGDVDLMQESVDKGINGDRIEMSDTNLAGTPKKWLYWKAGTADMVGNITTPTGTYDLYTSPTPDTAYSVRTTKQLLLDKGVILCKRPAGGKPEICNFLTQPEYDANIFPSSSIYVHGNVAALQAGRPKFENIKFSRMSAPLWMLSPFIVDLCEFVHSAIGIIPVVDNRITFPSLQVDRISDPTDLGMLTTEVTNCAFDHMFETSLFGWVSGLVWENNSVTNIGSEYPALLVEPSLGRGYEGDSFVTSQLGLPVGAVMSKYNCFNRIANCDFDGAESTAYFATWSGEAYGVGAKAYNNTIKDCAFANWNCGQCTEVGWAYESGQSHDNAVVDCSFTRCSGAVCADSGGGQTDPLVTPLVNGEISGNTFIACDEAVSMNWPTTEGTPGGGPAIFLRNTRGFHISGNDYTQCGLLPVPVVDDADVPILLIDSQHCSIAEKKTSFPIPSKPVSAWVISQNGQGVWIGKDGHPTEKDNHASRADHARAQMRSHRKIK